MALRYPLDVQGKGQPFILFSSHKAKYKNGARTLTDGDGCALYMPPGFQVADVMRYESASPGLAGGVVENLMNGNNDYDSSDVKQVATTAAGAATQTVAAAIASVVGGGAGGAVGAVGSQSVAAAVEATVAKKFQVITNPQEFMLFKAPGVRAFSFTFNMMPRSHDESIECEKIIKFFREKMYPTLTANDLMYQFPDVFTLTFGGLSEGAMPKIAESALTNATTAYNPNSMSYFKHGNRPVEISFTLSFQELMPLSAKNIKDGF